MKVVHTRLDQTWVYLQSKGALKTSSIRHMSVFWSVTLADRILRGPTCFRSCGKTSRTRWKWGGWKKYCVWASPRSLKVPDFFDFLHFLEIFCFVDMQRQSTSLAFYFEYWWRAKSKSVTTNRRNIMKGPLQSCRLPLSLRKQNI